MKPLLQRQWQQGGWLASLLTPLSWLTGLAVRVKGLAYRRGWRRATVLDVPVVVVGNIYVGGTGKTPFILATLAALQERGWTPGVISRGYGTRIGPTPRVGQGELDAAMFGDEPALIARQSGVPVAIHPRRGQAAWALRRAFPEVDVILSDDGLQHLALARDIEIVVQDRRGVGNGALLPAGPLREPAARLAHVDALVTNLTGERGAASPEPLPGPPDSPRRVSMQLHATHLRRVSDGHRCALNELPADARITAAAGIGHPARFFATLEQAGLHAAHTLALPDHFDYTISPFLALDTEFILVTEKDAVKCAHLNDSRIWAVSVTARLSDPTFFDWLDTRLHGHTLARHSGLPHHQGPAAP